MESPTLESLEADIRAAMATDDWETVDQLAPLLDRHDATARTQREAVSLHAAALWYAEQGLHVFPLQPRSKIPFERSHGCKDATTNPAQINRWWTGEPDANIGIATGHLVDVIDIDGPTGVRSWAKLDGLPPILGKVSTPRAGGNHLYIATAGLPNRAGLAPGVDIRGRGGYVVAPPSRTDQGMYVWYASLQVSALEVAA